VSRCRRPEAYAPQSLVDPRPTWCAAT
jgi:hypothetical protein